MKDDQRNVHLLGIVLDQDQRINIREDNTKEV